MVHQALIACLLVTSDCNALFAIDSNSLLDRLTDIVGEADRSPCSRIELIA